MKRPRFRPHMTNCAIPDATTLTVAVTGFHEQPQLQLVFGDQQINPRRVSKLSDGPGSGNWQAVFDCPRPDPLNGPPLHLVKSGMTRPLPSAVPSEPDLQRPVRDASTEEGTRWVQTDPLTATWRAQRTATEPRLAHIDVQPGAISLTLERTSQSTSAATRVISLRNPSGGEYRPNQTSDGSFSIDTQAMAALVATENLNGTSNWDVFLISEDGVKRHLWLASRDLVNAHTAVVYQQELRVVEQGRVSIRPYWSTRGFLRLTIEYSTDASVGGEPQ